MTGPHRASPARRLRAGPAALLLAAAVSLSLGAPAGALAQSGDGARSEAAADSLDLQDAIETALGEAPDMTTARADLSAAESGRWADWGALLPSASAAASFNRSNFTNFTFVSPEGVSRALEDPVTSTSKSASQGLSLSWTLLEGGARIAELMAGADRVDAAAHRLDLAERRTVAEVKRTYLEARKQVRLAELAREQLEARERDLEVTRERYRMAAVGRSDLLGAELEVEQARLALLEARDAARTARRALRVAMGVDPEAGGGAPLAGVPDPPDASRLETARLAERALSGNPELAALRADAEAASASLWGARARYLPTISIGFSLSRSENLGPEGDLFVFDPRNRGQSFSVQASWNLFSGFQRKDQTAQASASRTRANAERLRRRLELEKEVRDRVQEIRRRAERLEILRRSVELARQRRDLAREQYRLGTFDYLQLQNAVQQLNTAEEQLLRERYDYMVAWTNLEERVGGIR